MVENVIDTGNRRFIGFRAKNLFRYERCSGRNSSARLGTPRNTFSLADSRMIQRIMKVQVPIWFGAPQVSATTAMAVTIDLGEAGSVHPKNKREVGHRLALLARNDVYGENIAAHSPRFASMEIEGATVRVSFKKVGEGLKIQGEGPLKGFELAGENRVFYFANARIEGEKVQVGSEQVPEPVAVRYAWDHNPECNLFGKNGLPVAPFRTDSWPGRTEARFLNLLRSLKSKMVRRLTN